MLARWDRCVHAANLCSHTTGAVVLGRDPDVVLAYSGASPVQCQGLAAEFTDNLAQAVGSVWLTACPTEMHACDAEGSEVAKKRSSDVGDNSDTTAAAVSTADSSGRGAMGVTEQARALSLHGDSDGEPEAPGDAHGATLARMMSM